MTPNCHKILMECVIHSFHKLILIITTYQSLNCALNTNTKLCIIQFQPSRGFWSSKWTMVPQWAKCYRKRRHQGPLGHTAGAFNSAGALWVQVGQHQERVHVLASFYCQPFTLFGIGSSVFCAGSVLSSSGCIATRVSPDCRYLLGETRSISIWLLAVTPFSCVSLVLLHGLPFQWETLTE